MTEKVSSLDGLRGIAAFSVVISHMFYSFYTYLQVGHGPLKTLNFEKSLFHSPMSFFYNGSFALAIFFVISGYVLSRGFINHQDYGKLQHSTIKRYIRLGIPVFASVMLSWILVVLDFYPAREIQFSGWIGGLMLNADSNIFIALKEGLFSALVLGSKNYNYVLWTINVELIGSFLLFAYLALFSTYKHCWVIGALICTALIVNLNVDGIYYSLFIIGAHLNQTKKIKHRNLFIPLGVMIALYLGGYHWRSDSYLMLVRMADWIQDNTWVALYWPIFFPSIGAVLLVYLVTQGGFIEWLMTLRFVQWLGKISYSLYLIHPLVISSAGLNTFIWSEQYFSYHTSVLITGIVVLFISFLASSFLYRYVDSPSIALANRFGLWGQRKLK